MNDSIFLDEDDISTLTGCRRKSDQIDMLRSQGILFHINKSGCPVVPKAAVMGSKYERPDETWNPAIISK